MIIQHITRGIYHSRMILANILAWCNKPKILVYSSHGFLLPIIYYVTIHEPKTRIMSVFFTMVYTNFVFSIAFWSDPSLGTWIHFMDRIAARLSIVTLVLFTYLAKNLSMIVYAWFTGVVGMMYLFFNLSSVFSKQEWCSWPHLVTHLFAHLFAIIALFFLFL